MEAARRRLAPRARGLPVLQQRLGGVRDPERALDGEAVRGLGAADRVLVVERLANAIDALPPGRHTFEFRHQSWFVEDVYELLREKGVALTVGDHPSRPFQSYEFTADWTFVRFHYGHRGRRGNYSIAELEEWARRLEEWRRQVEVLVYFNNDWEEFAIRNGVWLKRRLGV